MFGKYSFFYILTQVCSLSPVTSDDTTLTFADTVHLEEGFGTIEYPGDSCSEQGFKIGVGCITGMYGRLSGLSILDVRSKFLLIQNKSNKLGIKMSVNDLRAETEKFSQIHFPSLTTPITNNSTLRLVVAA